MTMQAKRNSEEILRSYVNRKYKDPKIVIKEIQEDIKSFKEEIATEINQIKRNINNIKKKL